MKKQLLYMHGGDTFSSHEAFMQTLQERELRDVYGEGGRRWPDTLRESLSDTYEIFTPQMPNKQNAHYEEWKVWFERHIPHLRDGLTIIGWSLGGSFFAKYLSENESPAAIDTLFLLAAPFVTSTPVAGEIECGDFVLDATLVPNITKRVREIVLMHSKDDFVVPYAHLDRFVTCLPDATVERYTDKNHFLQDTFPELLAKL